MEARLNLLAIGRAGEGDGADWYVAPPGRGLDSDGRPDLDDPEVVALEVSGQDTGSVGARLTQKIAQVGAGNAPTPGMAAVVGFERAVVHVMSA